MPCSDSSSSIALRLSLDERFLSFDFAKITCGQEITFDTGYAKYCKGKTLREILTIPFSRAVADLNVQGEDRQFVLYLEWDSLRSSIAQYLGIDDPDIDRERCVISEVTQDEDTIEIAQVILPPKELPKILPCAAADNIKRGSS